MIDETSVGQGMTYASTGVSYEAMDPFKIEAQQAAVQTAGNIECHSYWEVPESRGESVYLIEGRDNYLAHVEEGLGTKNLVADAMYDRTGKSYYAAIAQDTVAMIVNDMITLGAKPLSVAMHLAVGDSEWFADQQRRHNLIDGWKKACDLAGCVWGGGETPTLKGVVYPNAVVLSGSAMGIIQPKKHRILGNIVHGDQIIMLASSGIHANGLTMARKIAENLPEGYLTKLSDGRTYGETLLEPTIIYARLIEDLLNIGTDIHYAVNITGHGWRKLMRSQLSFTYVITEMPKQQPLFDFIKEHGAVCDEEMYGNFNMGAGFAIYVPKHEVERVLTIVESYKDDRKLTAWHAGYIEESSERKVVIRPKNITFEGSTLNVR